MSTNKIWRSPRSGPLAGRVLKSKPARSYSRAVAKMLLFLHTPRNYIGHPCALTIEQHPPDHRRRDPDNGLKLLLDALVQAGVLHDDNSAIIRRLTIEQGPVQPLARALPVGGEEIEMLGWVHV